MLKVNYPLCWAAAMLLLLAMSATAGPSSAKAAELVVYHSKDCAVSQRFQREVVAHYGTTKGGRAFPMRLVDIEMRDADIILEQPVTQTPTFVFVDEGREMARITGYPGRAHFLRIIDAAADAFLSR